MPDSRHHQYSAKERKDNPEEAGNMAKLAPTRLGRTGSEASDPAQNGEKFR